jgi:hypothetical protein
MCLSVKFDIYKGDGKTRFVLGKSGTSPLAIFGANPSTADECKSDRTIDRIQKLLSVWKFGDRKFDGFLMFNLYPFRNSKPECLPRSHDADLLRRNVEQIQLELGQRNVHFVWAAWGDAFDKRAYFKDCLKKIIPVTTDLTWKRCEALTKRHHNPRHPLSGRPNIITEQSQLVCFDVEGYLQTKLIRDETI